MAISRSKPGPAALAVSGHHKFRMLSRKILYCRLLWVSLLGCSVLFPGIASGQEERPQITPGERKVPRKKDAGPRAVGVLQMAANGKATLVPIAILVNGKFFDASAYKADPVPMALDSGNIYEGERTGNSAGLFTVNAALHSNAQSVQSPWIGTGSWLPNGTESPDKGMKAEASPVGIQEVEGPPRLTKNPAAVNTPPPTSKDPAPAKTPSTSGPSSSGPSSSGPSSDEPPRLSKPKSDSGDSSGSAQSAPSTPDKAGDSKPGGSKPADTKTEAKAEDGPKVPKSDSGASEANRPRLRRGKPVESFADEEIPGYSKFGSTPSADKKPAETATSSPVQLIPAISDAAGPDPRSYKFEWIKGEEGDRRQQMTNFAKEQLKAYINAQAKAIIPATPAGAKTGRTAKKKAPEPILENEQMTAFDLWNNNVPVIIYSAEAHLPPPPAGTPQSTSTQTQYSILLVAYPDMYGNLRKIYSGVTDRFHLDITPRLDLVDAVDADGDGRGELLFKKTSDAGNGWVIYRATADKLWKMFDSLNPD